MRDSTRKRADGFEPLGFLQIGLELLILLLRLNPVGHVKEDAVDARKRTVIRKDGGAAVFDPFDFIARKRYPAHEGYRCLAFAKAFEGIDHKLPLFGMDECNGIVE